MEITNFLERWKQTVDTPIDHRRILFNWIFQIFHCPWYLWRTRLCMVGTINPPKKGYIISAVNAQAKQTTQKYGVAVPRSLEKSYILDTKNGNTLWRDALEKEISNLQVAFDILDTECNTPPGWSKASSHIIFDVRMILEQKDQWLKDGHRTPESENSTYADVVSWESVRINLTYAALNGLYVCACDVQNSYLQSPSSEKHFIIRGPEFGLDIVRNKARTIRAIYGGNRDGVYYWRHFWSAMDEVGFESCKSDPDVWYRSSMKDNSTD